jgi:hypothetical protein
VKNWTDLLLAFFAALSPLAAAIGGMLFYRENKRKKGLDLVQQAINIEIDENTRNKLVQEAAQLNQVREEEREEWWSRQIQTLRDEIDAERRLSNRRFRRLNQLEDWAMLHVAWDRKAWASLKETYPDWDPPPVLPEDIAAIERELNGDL